MTKRPAKRSAILNFFFVRLLWDTLVWNLTRDWPYNNQSHDRLYFSKDGGRHVENVLVQDRYLFPKMDYFEEQREEIESLKAIFPDEFAEISVDPPCFMIRLDELDLQSPGFVQIKITLPRTYPDEIPIIEIPNRSETLPINIVNELQSNLDATAKESVGMAMVFTIINEAKEWISNNCDKIKEEKCQLKPSDKLPSSDGEDEDDLSTSTVYTDKSGGRWDYVIGLIGKPRVSNR